MMFLKLLLLLLTLHGRPTPKAQPRKPEPVRKVCYFVETAGGVEKRCS